MQKESPSGGDFRDADLIRDGPSEFSPLRPQWAMRSLVPPGNARPAQEGRRGWRSWEGGAWRGRVSTVPEMWQHPGVLHYLVWKRVCLLL